MALHRGSTGRRSSRNGDDRETEDEIENSGYIQVLMKPLDQGSYSVLLGWLGMTASKLDSQQIGALYALGGVLSCVITYQLIFSDLGFLFHRLSGLIVQVFSIICAFYWLTLCFRKSWSTTSIYIMFCACFAGEFLGQCVCDSNTSSETYITQPFLTLGVLVSVSVASIFSTLETLHSTFVIAFVSFIRFLACTSLSDLPQSVRPFLAYFSGMAGVVGAKYMEAVLKPPVTNLMTHDGKIPVIKRRRSSSSATHSFSTHRAGRRTSLPALIQKGQGNSSYESTIIGEAHGLISDMLADSGLPPHVVSGLQAVSSLLKPPENHNPVHKPKVSPLVSLTEASNYGSDSEDLPYTGERPSSLPKRLRRSLPPSLIRRMSTSTWTTTTSATGMPTLEPEPCRTRSSSFRHSRDNTPGSSPQGSRSNSPSPNSPTPISLTIPKSRSFSVTSVTNPSSLNNQKRGTRERRSLGFAPGFGSDSSTSPNLPEKVSPLALGEPDISKEGDSRSGNTGRDSRPVLPRRLNITSDYESNDSPSSSDHSDNVTTADDILRSRSADISATLTSTDPAYLSRVNCEGLSVETCSSWNTSPAPPGAVTGHHRDVTRPADLDTSLTSTASSSKPPHLSKDIPATAAGAVALVTAAASTGAGGYLSLSPQDRLPGPPGGLPAATLPYDLKEIHNRELLNVNNLNLWDYPIFDLASEAPDTILSMVTYKLFSETGLFDTFRIPINEFLTYFHALELGYREKPYHNRIHATDVLHGVYYLTTQPIPGFQQINPEGDIFQKAASSSESDSEAGEKSGTNGMRTTFTAEDSYGIMGGNFPPLELMALYTASAMHDYDHPGRTNAFLVTTHSPVSVLYNDRSVLENHHAASAWALYLADPRYNWLAHLDKTEFKRFRYLVIEAILATDLKRHFELVAEFNSKVNEEDSVGIDWMSEGDRQMVANMVIKMADINGPAKRKDLHIRWTNSISEEFYEQGDEEESLGLPISPYMDRQKPQLAKLQESFINHLVAPLCNAVGGAGLLPGNWVDEESDTEANSETDKGDSTCKDTEDEENDIATAVSASDRRKRRGKKIHCWLTKNLKDNHELWVNVLKKEAAQKQEQEVTTITSQKEADSNKEGRKSITEKEGLVKQEMEPITEEDTPPSSANSIKDAISIDYSRSTTLLLSSLNQSQAAASKGGPSQNCSIPATAAQILQSSQSPGSIAAEGLCQSKTSDSVVQASQSLTEHSVTVSTSTGLLPSDVVHTETSSKAPERTADCNSRNTT